MLQDVNTDLSGDPFRFSSNVQDLLTARAQIEQIEVIAFCFLQKELLKYNREDNDEN